MARLGDVFVLIRNGASIKQTDGADGIPITRIETISNREVDRNKFGYAGIHDIQKYSDYILKNKDILMSHINSEKHLGKSAIYYAEENEQIIHGMNLLMLRANCDILYPKYALYYFDTPFFQQQIIRITKKSVNQASFTVTALKDIEIPLPILEVQKSIAEILDEVSDLISLRKQQLAKLDELVKARFVEMFGGYSQNVVKAETFMYEMRNGLSPSSSGKYYEKVLTLSAVTQGSFDVTAWKDGYFEDCPPNNKRICATDFYICRGNGNKALVGTGVYSPKDHFELVFPDTVIAARVDEEIARLPYLYMAWQMPNVREQIEKNARTTNGTYKINQKVISNVELIVPPLSIQDEFVRFLRQANRQKLTIQQSLDKLEVLKKSLMQEYFG